MKRNILILIPVFFVAAVISITWAELERRKEFDLHLPLISTTIKPNGEIDEVFVTYENSHEGWGISPGDDRYVKDNRKLRLDHTFREIPQQAYLLSPFEAELINRVAGDLKEVVTILERDLKGERWDRVLYLDAHLPHFLKNFYYLICSARCSYKALPVVTAIADSLFENSVTSKKSDIRIRKWRLIPGQIMKLRIAAKELAFQIEQWQKKELANPKRDAWEDSSKKFAESYELFVRLYFNLPPR
ncbi:MAG: hypothetical protein GX089_14285 [Fibrobacter sp.]|mgnify:FL=1|jgi:hypothetical protein|nr:hypothetical protein [Fibrobacter sp.]